MREAIIGHSRHSEALASLVVVIFLCTGHYRNARSDRSGACRRLISERHQILRARSSNVNDQQPHSAALSSTQRHSAALRGTQRHSAAFRGIPRHSAALRGIQSRSVALSGNEWQSVAPQRSASNLHLHLHLNLNLNLNLSHLNGRPDKRDARGTEGACKLRRFGQEACAHRGREAMW